LEKDEMIIICVKWASVSAGFSAFESCGTGVLTGVMVLAVYVSQIND